ncbi:MAG TPA: serine hydrolase domain-containing protein [Bradyrhizobium sp.]
MSSDDVARIGRITADLRRQSPCPPGQSSSRTLGERMAELGTPSASVAVIDNFEVAWARGFGVRKQGEPAPVLADTPFQTGSVSKAVFAVAAMRLAQDKRIDLDADVRFYLKSWRLPHGDDGWQPKITLRQLLSHTAGTTVHGFPGYPAGAPVPSLPQVLDGTPPANTQAVYVDLIPGFQFRYSGGGTTIAQLAMTEVVGRPFTELMRELVLAPLAMEDSSYEQPPPSRIADRAALAHPLSAVPAAGGWNVYPEMAAAGLWTTARDVARLGVAVMRGLHGETSRLGLSQESLSEMVRPQLPDHVAGTDFVGLGWYCFGEGGAFRFGHAGWNHGFVADARFYPVTGQGSVVIINSNQGWPLIEELIKSMEREYRWPMPAQAAGETLPATAIAGTYRDNCDRIFQLRHTNGKLLLQIGDQDAIGLSPGPNGDFSAKVPQISLRLAPNGDGPPGLRLTQGGKTFEAARIADRPS